MLKYTVFPRIVSGLEYFPLLNSFRTFMYCDIRPNSKNNSFRGNYLRKYGSYLIMIKTKFKMVEANPFAFQAFY